METKLAQLKAAWAAGDKAAALRIAGKFPRLGEFADTIRKGASAAANPRFYSELGADVDALVAAAYEAVRTRYQLEGD